MTDPFKKEVEAKVPGELKALNDFMIWAGEKGQAANAEAFVDALKDQDWAGALKYKDKLEEFAHMTEGVEKMAGALDVLDKVGKAVEIAEAAERGDYLYAGTKLGAEVVDQIASGYLQSLGPGGVAVDHITHAVGDQLAANMNDSYAAERAAVDAKADSNDLSVQVWQDFRERTEGQVKEQLEAGKSPEEVQAWARDQMEAHGAIYDNLDRMEDFGQNQHGRMISDQVWIIDRTYDMWKELDAESQGSIVVEKPEQETVTTEPSGDDPQSGGFLDGWRDVVTAVKEAPGDFVEAATNAVGILKDSVIQGSDILTETLAKAEARVQKVDAPEVTSQADVVELQPELEENIEPPVEQTESVSSFPEIAPVEIVTETPGQPIEVIAATPADTPIEADFSTIEIPLTQNDAEWETYPVEEATQEPEAFTETDRLDALVSQMAREGASATDQTTEQLDALVTIIATSENSVEADLPTDGEVYDGVAETNIEYDHYDNESVS